MHKKLSVAIIYNEPTIQTQTGRKFISELKINSILINHPNTPAKGIDLSEVGILEEKQDIQNALQKLGHACSIFNVADDIQNLIKFIEGTNPDVIFNMVEGIGDCSIHEMHIAGIYELLDVTYTGAGPVCLGLCLNKNKTKEILIANNISTPKFALCTASELGKEISKLKYPLIVKPAGEDASNGIDNNSIVYNRRSLNKQVKYICRKFKGKAIVEEYINGREINVAVIGNKKPRTLPISEISFAKLQKHLPPIVTYNAKWISGSDEYKGTNGVCPAELPKRLEKEINAIALKAFKIMGCRDYARVDMRLNKNGKPFVLEVNPNPDISDDAGFARSSKAGGYTYEEIVQQILVYASERNKKITTRKKKTRLVGISA